MMKRVALLTGALALTGGSYGLFSPAVAHADAAAEIRAGNSHYGVEIPRLGANGDTLRSDKLYVFDVYPPRAYKLGCVHVIEHVAGTDKDGQTTYNRLAFEPWRAKLN
jgi:hypothetical protein